MFKRPTRKQAGHFMLSVQSCFEWGLQCPFCYQKGGSLLHCPFTLTGEYPAVCSLLHFPGSHLHRPLAGILPCEARTFLSCVLSAIAAAIIYLTHNYLNYHTLKINSILIYTGNTLPPTNSLNIELLGTFSFGIPKI